MLVRNGARRRAGGLFGLALVIALGLGTALGALAIAWRTDHAYPSYLHEADVGEMVVNPGLFTDRLDQIMSSIPGVVDVVSDSFYVASADEGAPRPRAEVESSDLQVRASRDGRFQRRDRPVVHRGRLISGRGEAFLSLDAAESLGLDVGDDLPLAFWSASPNEDELDPSEVVEPIGRNGAKVVGVGVFSDEVLPDELYSHRRVVVSHDVVAPFDCTPPHPPPDDSLTLEELTAVFFPARCARDPMFYSLRVSGGARGVPAVHDALAKRFEQVNEQLPRVMRELNLGFSVAPTLTSEESVRVRRSLGPSVTALQLFGLVAGFATLAVTGLGGVRTLRRAEADSRVWFDLGMTRRTRALAAGLPLGAAGGVGVVGALLVGWLLSAVGPLASARALDPEPSPALPGMLAAGVTTGALAVLIAVFAAAAWLATHAHPGPAPARPSRWGERAARTGNVPLAMGVRAALPGAVGGAGPRAVLTGAVAALAAVTASAVFSSNMSGLVADPARFGWPFDVGVVINLGYAGADEQIVAESLGRAEIEDWTTAALPGEVTVKGESLPGLAGRPGFDDLPLPVIAGRYPTDDEEIALGVRSAERLSLAVGDRVTVGSIFGERDATVSGLVVLPSLGPYQAERVGLGAGVLMSSRFFGQLVGTAEEERGLPPGAMAGSLGAFVGIHLRDGVDADAFVRELREVVAEWDVDGFPPQVYSRAVRPPEVADVAAIRSAPALLAALLGATMAVALALAVTLATRARRRELSILLALGCTARQLRLSIAWHAVTVVCVGLLGGVVLGLALGSASWRQFAKGLGIVPSVEIAVVWLGVIGLAAVVVALVAGAIPAATIPRRVSAGELQQR